MSDPQPPPTPSGLLNPRVQAAIAVLLLVMFAGVLFVPAIVPGFKLDASVAQVLMTLATVAVTYYLGSSSGSKDKDTALQAAASAAIPPPVVTVVAAPAPAPQMAVEAPIAREAASGPPAPSSASATPPVAAAVAIQTESDPTLPDPSLPWPIVWAAVVMLGRRELLRLLPYLDVTGTPTQGWGETEGVTMASPAWTRPQADQRLCDELVKYAAATRAMCTVAPTPNQLGALVVCDYNIGLAGMAGSTMMRKHNASDFAGAAAAFALWNKATVNGALVVEPSLVAARANEAALYLLPEAGAPRVPVAQAVAVPPTTA